MHCPSCGKPATHDQQFCRICGMNLETVGELVARHSTTPEQIQTKIDKAEAEKVIVSRMFNWITWGMIILGLGVAMLAINKFLDLGKPFQLVISFLLLGGAGIATAGVLNGLRQGVNISGKRHGTELPTSPQTKSLPTNPFPDSLQSVTEGTTKLIGEEKVLITKN